MLTCHEVQELIPEYMAGDVALAEVRALELHVQTCQSCAAEVNELSWIWDLLGQWPQEVPSARTLNVIRQTVLSDLAPRQNAALTREQLPGRKLMWAVADGLLFTLGSVVVMTGVASLEGFSASVLLGSGALWSALYILTFALYFRAETHNGATVNLRAIALAGLLTMGFSLLAARTLSVGKLVHYCQFSPWGATLFRCMGEQGAYFLFGALYALVPLLAISFTFGEKVRRRPMVHGLLCAGLFFLLTLPAIYLQCGAFSLGVSVSWIAGAFLGSFAAAPLGFWLRMQSQSQTR
ncbi:MAG: anti-sigma factor family protein [Candidatus Binatia bacterium]